MRTITLAALTGMFAMAPSGVAAADSIREFVANEVAKGYIVAVDEKTGSFDFRTSMGIVRARNPESIQFVDRFGANLPWMTLAKCRDNGCLLTVMAGGAAGPGVYNFYITVDYITFEAHC